MDRLVAWLDRKRESPGEGIFLIFQNEMPASTRQISENFPEICIDGSKSCHERLELHLFESLYPLKEIRPLP